MKKIALISGLIVYMFLGSLLPAFASSGRDCDDNAIIRCGALSVSELKSKIYSNDQLKSYYHTIGIKEQQFDKLKWGSVKKDGTVWVGDKKVASNVYSSGRHFMSGSTRDDRFSYPIYWRHPEVSFASNSLSAFVYLNYDGSFGYAVIRACGNPVTKNFNANIKTKPEPPKPEPKFDIMVNKFEDLNANKKRENTEKMLSGWNFRLTGNGINQTGYTNTKGQVEFEDIKNGTYTLTETLKPNWQSTTGAKKTIQVNGSNVNVWFGNRQVPVISQTNRSITINKYEDINANRKKDTNEKFLANWQFTLTGQNITRTGTTNQNGQIVFSNLPAGNYTIKETIKPGWKSVTKNPFQVALSNQDVIIWFGNKQNSNVIVTDIEVPEPQEPIIETKGVTNLPEAGNSEIFLSVILLLLSMSGFYYFKSRFALRNLRLN